MELTQILSWVGTGTGMLIGIPQLAKTIQKNKQEACPLQRLY